MVKQESCLSADRVRELSELAESSIGRSTEALLSRQEDALEAEFSKNFTVSGGDWRFADRDDLIKRVSSGNVSYDYIKTDVERIDIPNEQVAIVSGVRSVKAVVDGKDFASTFPFKAVHVLEDGRWRVAMWAVNC